MKLSTKRRYAQITLIQRRTDGQCGLFPGRPKPECPLPRWYAEAEFRGWQRSGDGSTENAARHNAISNVIKAAACGDCNACLGGAAHQCVMFG